MELNPIVIDNGGFQIKAGFAGDDAPVCIIPTVGGYEKGTVEVKKKPINLGHDTISNSNKSSLKRPIEYGIITDFDLMEELWMYTFNQLSIDPLENCMLLSECYLNPKINREKMAQIFFESFNIPALRIVNSGILSLYSSGRSTGVVVDCGEGHCSAIPIWEGYLQNEGSDRINYGGEHINKMLAKKLKSHGYSFSTISDLETVREIKQKLSFVSLDYNLDVSSSKISDKFDSEFTLPDGQTLRVNSERFDCIEPLFSPHLFGQNFKGIVTLIRDSIMRCEINARSDLSCNIVLSGGTTLTRGFRERLNFELSSLFSARHIVRVVASPERAISTWIGGSILGSLSGYFAGWTTREEYMDSGPSIIYRKNYS